MRRESLPAPAESVEQQYLFQWARMQAGRWPELEMLYHVPNEGKRNPAAGARLVAEGLKRGVPDICLPVARGGCHGLYIGLKRGRGRVVSREQERWIRALAQEGYCAAVCRGWEAAAKLILRYLAGEIGPDAYGEERAGERG